MRNSGANVASSVQKDRVRELCSRALEGRLTREEFHARFPIDARTDAFVDQLFWDLTDAVEHLPGKWGSGEVDFEAWRQSDEYLTLYLDFRLLDLPVGPLEALRRRTIVVAHAPLSKALIDSQLLELGD